MRVILTHKLFTPDNCRFCPVSVDAISQNSDCVLIFVFISVKLAKQSFVFVSLDIFLSVFVFLFVSVKLAKHGQRISSSSLGHRRKCGRPLFYQAANPDENYLVWNIGQIAFQKDEHAQMSSILMFWFKANVLLTCDTWADLNRFEDIWSLIIDLSHLTFVIVDLFISDI